MSETSLAPAGLYRLTFMQFTRTTRPKLPGALIMRIHVAAIVAAALFSASPLAAQDAADLFGKLDANKDGYVTPDEVQESQKALYERMLRNADKDGDKKLSKEEFIAGLRPDDGPKTPLAGGQPFGPPGGKAKGDPREFFNRMDANKDGKLS